MHRIARLALSITFIATVAVGQSQQPASPIGRWRSTATSSSGVSTILEFHDGGQLDSHAAAITEGKYRLLGTDTIILQSNNREEKRELEWDNQDRARIEDEAAGKSIELARVGKATDSKNPLIGEWSATLEREGRRYPARVVFRADGNVIWITFLSSQHGSYSLQDKKIRLEVPGHPAIEGSLSMTADRLTLPSPSGAAATFDRL